MPYILALSKGNPPYSCSQKNFLETFQASFALKTKEKTRLAKILTNSQIENRYFSIKDYNNSRIEGSFFGKDFPHTIPDMTKRNKFYIKHAPILAHNVAKKALEEWGGNAKEISHIISVSCTGMIAPGIEFSLLESLELSRSVNRLGINFMGCFGAFKGLSLAKSIANENPQNRILLVCTELCSLHLQAEQTINNFIGNALFADGAAAAIIGGSARDFECPLFKIISSSCLALEDSKDEMTWEASNTGMLMKLSAKVPILIKKQIQPFSQSILPKGLTFSDCDWAIHPGGKAILEAIEHTCKLDKSQTEASWQTLSNYGNMSSATFLFVLKALLETNSSKKSIIGLGFGPGLSIEGLFLERLR